MSNTKTFIILAGYILILIWMFVPNELFFKLIVILFLMGLTVDEIKPFTKGRVNG